ncbi:fimbrial biogenesis chaperone [Stenotrophomonas beteli]|uniref:Molecular chaperone n=1 Tax=Stenotrophomonas beteli TaxID=3384461 RepID=A0A0R0BEB7_9GAMM|nr:molecular chaperone [Stenotrophomonas maltophilia]KRG52538.1 hypothetical protein ARC23_05250 [Stenotrophomonas maltophilia]
MRPLNVISYVLLLLLSFPVAADLKLHGTRVVLDGAVQAGAIRISNTGDAPVLVQSWVGGGDADTKPELLRVPLTATTPMFRLNPGERRNINVRVVEPGQLPLNRESLFWLNILDVPARTSDQSRTTVEQAVHVRLKVFHRPAGLPGKPEAAVDALQWRIGRSASGAPVLRALNPCPYYVSLRTVTLNGRALPVSAIDAAIPPFGEWSRELDQEPSAYSSHPSLQLAWIDDEGLVHEWTGHAESGTRE